MSGPVHAPAPSAIEQHTGGGPLAVLSLDPGVTTGICLGRYSDNTLVLTPCQEQLSLLGLHEYLDMFKRANEQWHTLHIVYEDFSYRNQARRGLDLTPVKLIGVIEMHKEMFEPFISYTKQSAAAGKGFYSDEKLKDLGVYVAGLQHGRDATRHLLQWANFGAGSAWMNLEDTKVVLDLDD
ncbi:MAG TPA: hypothetical protein VJQ25_04395 [Nitrospira sp.]|nr:hypothetical protein [Nitrospira sp.]